MSTYIFKRPLQRFTKVNNKIFIVTNRQFELHVLLDTPALFEKKRKIRRNEL